MLVVTTEGLGAHSTTIKLLSGLYRKHAETKVKYKLKLNLSIKLLLKAETLRSHAQEEI